MASTEFGFVDREMHKAYMTLELFQLWEKRQIFLPTKQ